MESQHTPKQRWSRRLTLTVLIGLLAAVGLLIAVGGSFRPACSVCHRAQTVALGESAHLGVNCYRCHLPNGAWSVPSEKAGEVFRMYPKAVLGMGFRNPAVQTSRAACLECHREVLEGVTTGSGLRVQHSSCAGDSSCDPCHSAVAHSSSVRWNGAPVMDDCVACHRQKSVSTECPTCHLESKKKSTRSRGPWQVTHGKDWKKTHGMGQTDSCATCHPQGFCAKCHRVSVPHPVEFGSTHGELAIADPQSCESCHKSRRFCDACHGMAMPHPVGFLKDHRTLSRGRHDPSCLRCHAATDCDNCHANHVHPGGSKGVPIPWTYTQDGPK